jgi:hypothetical protein
LGQSWGTQLGQVLGVLEAVQVSIWPEPVHWVAPTTQVQHWPPAQPTAPQSVPFCHSVQPLAAVAHDWGMEPEHCRSPALQALVQVVAHWPLVQNSEPGQEVPSAQS